MTHIRVIRQMTTVLLTVLVGSISFSFTFPKDSNSTKIAPGIIVPGTYLVVGVFEFEDNAKNFTKHVREEGFSAHYAFYPPSGYFYVYTSSATSTQEMSQAYRNLRASQEFSDAWVFVAEGSETQPTSSRPTDSRLAHIEPTLDAPEVIPSVITKSHKAEKIERLKQQPMLYVKFRAHQAANQKAVKASVKVVEGVRSKNLGEIATNEVFNINKTEVLDSILQIMPYAIGYRKVQFDLPLNISPTDSAWQLAEYEGDTLVMNMPLQRLKKGDIQVMFNTYFYGNSAVMRERSRYEMDQLVEMLHEKPSMQIKLHGHTNGSGRGFIYTFSEEDQNFFKLIQNKEHKKKGVGSIKLSALRTETIKAYLEHNGITSDRIETEGWGGKRMLYPEDGPLSKHNIRVEIEVTKE